MLSSKVCEPSGKIFGGALHPREELVIILMTQCAWASPSPPNVYFWTLAYQAFDD